MKFGFFLVEILPFCYKDNQARRQKKLNISLYLGGLVANVFWLPVSASIKIGSWLHYDYPVPFSGLVRGGEYILTLDYIRDYIERSYHEVQDWITKKF